MLKRGPKPWGSTKWATLSISVPKLRRAAFARDASISEELGRKVCKGPSSFPGVAPSSGLASADLRPCLRPIVQPKTPAANTKTGQLEITSQADTNQPGTDAANLSTGSFHPQTLASRGTIQSTNPFRTAAAAASTKSQTLSVPFSNFSDQCRTSTVFPPLLNGAAAPANHHSNQAPATKVAAIKKRPSWGASRQTYGDTATELWEQNTQSLLVQPAGEQHYSALPRIK